MKGEGGCGGGGSLLYYEFLNMCTYIVSPCVPSSGRLEEGLSGTRWESAAVVVGHGRSWGTESMLCGTGTDTLAHKPFPLVQPNIAACGFGLLSIQRRR